MVGLACFRILASEVYITAASRTLPLRFQAVIKLGANAPRETKIHEPKGPLGRQLGGGVAGQKNRYFNQKHIFLRGIHIGQITDLF